MLEKHGHIPVLLEYSRHQCTWNRRLHLAAVGPDVTLHRGCLVARIAHSESQFRHAMKFAMRVRNRRTVRLSPVVVLHGSHQTTPGTSEVRQW